MKHIAFLILFVAFNSHAGSDKPMVQEGDGAASFQADNLMTDCVTPFPGLEPGAPFETECQVASPNYQGSLEVDGAAAEAIYATMNGVAIHPEAKDLDSKDINQVSWDDVEYKKGKDIFCFKKPGKDAHGKPTRSTSCSIQFNNLKKGAL
jgi:hypothetical protein